LGIPRRESSVVDWGSRGRASAGGTGRPRRRRCLRSGERPRWVYGLLAWAAPVWGAPRGPRASASAARNQQRHPCRQRW
jgi:hypothetical protein